MSKDISNHKKATEFADAVRSLLGLKGMESALRHLNPLTKSSVIGIYNNSYNASSDSKIQEYTKTIDDCNETISKLTARIEELDQQIEAARTRKQQKSEELKQYEDSEKLQLERERIQKEIDAANRTKSNMVKAACSDFNSGVASFLSIWMIQKSLGLLQDKDFTGKDIPHMHEDTIDYLVGRGRCICGTHLDVGSMAYEKVIALKNFLPPKSLSSNIADFRKSATRRVSTAQQNNLQESIAEHLSIISTQEDELTNYAEELHAIDEKLNGEDVRDKVKAINKEIQFCTQTINSSNKERDKCNSDIGAANSTRSRAITKRGELALLDDKNKKIF